MARLNMCAITRVLAWAAFAGVAAATLSASDAIGWLVAVITAAVVVGVQAVRPSSAACNVTASSTAERSELLDRGRPDVLTVPTHSSARRSDPEPADERI